MIPVSLTIKGLYSYQQETVIDFTPLTAAGLFGIFGAVGSGKSTILEAITFALYGETERLNSRDSRGYNMMNLKSNELLIDFVFNSGSQQEKYRFTVGSKRNKKRYLETTTFERKAYQWNNDNWQPTAKTADEILGLSYDNFKRTVIIPQGRFQEFLQLKETERVQMLKEIFSLEKYELGHKVAALTKANDLKISNIEGQMLALPVIDVGALQIRENEIVIYQKELDEKTIELQRIQEEEKALQLLKQLFEDLQKKIFFWNKLKEKEEEFILLEKNVNEYENCEKTFKSLFDTKSKLGKRIDEKSENLSRQKGELNILEHSIKEGELFLKNLEKSFRDKDFLLQKAIELEKIIFIKKLNNTVENFSNRIIKGQELIEQKEQGLVHLKTAILALQETVSTKEKSLPDTNTLIVLSSWFSKKNQLANAITKETIENNQLESQVLDTTQKISQELKNLPSEILFNSVPDTIELVQANIEKVVIENYNALKVLKDELANLVLSQKLQLFVQNIQPGEECPLCGSVHHPNILSVENVNSELIALEEKIKSLENKSILIQKISLKLSGLYADYASQKVNASKWKENLEKLKNELNIHKKEFLFPGYKMEDEQQLKEELKLLEENNNVLNELRQQISGSQTEAEKIFKSINDYKSGVEKINLEMAQSEGELKTLESQVLLHNLHEEIEKEDTDLQNQVSTYKNEFKKLTTDYELASKLLQQNLTTHGNIKGKIEEAENQLFIENADFERTVASIHSLLYQNGYADPQNVLEILGKHTNIFIEKENISHYKRELYAAHIQKAEAENKVFGKNYDEQVHFSLKEQIANGLILVKGKTELLTNSKQELSQFKQHLIKKEKLQKEFNALTERSGNLKTLSNLFRSGGFVNYVSSVYLQNLINSANKRFYKMTRQKLLLELNQDNSFQVRDFFNNGELRSIKTLSGGQMFQAALALALALADNIQHLTYSAENFFFIDEGFGSLDRESLSVVLDTLQTLKKENRIVGVISHVEEMQQEINVNLKITNNEHNGSMVFKPWI